MDESGITTTTTREEEEKEKEEEIGRGGGGGGTEPMAKKIKPNDLSAKQAEILALTEKRLAENKEAKEAAQAKVAKARLELESRLEELNKLSGELDAAARREDGRLRSIYLSVQTLLSTCNSNGSASASVPSKRLEAILRRSKAELAFKQRYSFREVAAQSEKGAVPFGVLYVPQTELDSLCCKTGSNNISSYLCVPQGAPLSFESGQAEIARMHMEPFDVCRKRLGGQGGSTDVTAQLSTYELKACEEASRELLALRAPCNVRVVGVSSIKLALCFTEALFEEEVQVLAEHGITEQITYEATMCQGCLGQWAKYALVREGAAYVLEELFSAEHTYDVRVRARRGDERSEWSAALKFKPRYDQCFSWKRCPMSTAIERRYAVDKDNVHVITKTGPGKCCSVAVGGAIVPPQRVVSWTIKALSTKKDGCGPTFVGVAPYDIDQNADAAYSRCGWYLCSCYGPSFYSGPPHNFVKKTWDEGQAKVKKEVVEVAEVEGEEQRADVLSKCGDEVSVTMDAEKGDLSFALKGACLGGYKAIPLDKPLVPCVILFNEGDSVEFCQ